jgi:hypothetical protein
MMSRRTEISVLFGLLVVLAVVYYFSNRTTNSGMPGVLAADAKFEPLDVREPQLRLDLLARLQRLTYTGSRRNIFLALPPPPPRGAEQPAPAPERTLVGPLPPPPPPPLQVPAEFFGFATTPTTGRRVAFFTSGDEVLVVAEGDTFLNRFRLDHIGNESADIEELATGRHATAPMVQAPAEQGAPP